MPMTETKLREVIEKLRGMVEIRLEDRNHLRTMPDKMLKFLEEGRREKLMRWIGFMQGALWVYGVDLEDLKAMNMPDPEPAAESKGGCNCGGEGRDGHHPSCPSFKEGFITP